jgi:hypothetical protein
MRLVILIPPLALLAASWACYAADATDLAVVVHKSTTLATIPSADLRLMILGERPKWPDGTKVTAVETPADSPETVLLWKAVFKMSDAVLKRYYMYATFTGKEIAPPKDFPSAAALKQFVARTPGAIGCILASEVDSTIKVLKVDGAAPGEPAYKLR